MSVYSDFTHMTSYTTGCRLLEESLNKKSLHLQLRVGTGIVSPPAHTIAQQSRQGGPTEELGAYVEELSSAAQLPDRG